MSKTTICCELQRFSKLSKTSRRCSLQRLKHSWAWTNRCCNLQHLRHSNKTSTRHNLQRLKRFKISDRRNLQHLKRSKTSKCCNCLRLKRSKTKKERATPSQKKESHILATKLRPYHQVVANPGSSVSSTEGGLLCSFPYHAYVKSATLFCDCGSWCSCRGIAVGKFGFVYQLGPRTLATKASCLDKPQKEVLALYHIQTKPPDNPALTLSKLLPSP